MNYGTRSGALLLFSIVMGLCGCVAKNEEQASAHEFKEQESIGLVGPVKYMEVVYQNSRKSQLLTQEQQGALFYRLERLRDRELVVGKKFGYRYVLTAYAEKPFSVSTSKWDLVPSIDGDQIVISGAEKRSYLDAPEICEWLEKEFGLEKH